MSLNIVARSPELSMLAAAYKLVKYLCAGATPGTNKKSWFVYLMNPLDRFNGHHSGVEGVRF